MAREQRARQQTERERYQHHAEGEPGHDPPRDHSGPPGSEEPVRPGESASGIARAAGPDAARTKRSETPCRSGAGDDAQDTSPPSEQRTLEQARRAGGRIEAGETPEERNRDVTADDDEIPDRGRSNP